MARYASRVAAQAPPCVTAPSGMVSWWPGDGNANDIQSSNNGTLQNGASFSAGIVGQAFNLDGVDDHVFIGNPANLNSFPAGITIDAWINPSQAPVFDPAPSNNLYSIVSKWGQSGQTDAYTLLLWNRDGTVRLRGGIGVPGSADTTDIALIGGEVPVGVWTHVAMTYDTATGVNRIFVNGQQAGQRLRPGGITQSNLNVLIGREDSNLPRPFKGLIDEVEIFNRPLSASEIQSIFSAGSAGKCKASECCPSGVRCSLPVPATSNPWLAGMPDGTNAGDGDFAPAQSPKEVDCLPVRVGDRLTFTSSGTVSNCPSGCPVSGPDGSTEIVSHNRGAQFNISNITAPGNSLLGVFLGPGRPDEDPFIPPPLDFSTFNSRNYDNLSPLLKQVFFIGDGRRVTTAGPLCQTVTVPAGATRLFLGTMDGFEWNNNIGAFTVSVCKLERPSFDTCLQDESNGNQLLLNLATGDYLFANCNGFAVVGRGTVTIRGCTVTLQADRSDGRVQAQLDTCTKIGKATIQIFSQGLTNTIMDRNIANSACACLSTKADLVVDPVPGLSGRIAFCRTENGNLIIRVRNRGALDAPPSITRVEFFPGGAFFLPTPLVPANGTVDLAPLDFPAACSNPDCDFTITVDSNGDVDESDEANNIAEGTCPG